MRRGHPRGRDLLAAVLGDHTVCFLDPGAGPRTAAVLDALGPLLDLPGAGVDREVMARTVDWIQAHWDWPSTWGWDYPMVAMTAARLEAPELAVDVLLKTDGPNNAYTAAGHNPNTGLPVYLPGNGALLAAVGMMAGGWDNGPDRPAPGFPDNGKWVVKAEGFSKLP